MRSFTAPAVVTSDEDLVRRIVDADDQHSFILLIKRYTSRIRRMLYSLFLGSIEQIEDAEQEIWARLYVALPRFRFESSFSTFCYRFSHNVAISILRRHIGERRRRQKVIEQTTIRSPKTPEELVSEEEAKRDLMSAMAELDKDARFLLHLRLFEELPLEEIAIIMKRPIGTIKSRLHRTRARLRTKMKERGYE